MHDTCRTKESRRRILPIVGPALLNHLSDGGRNHDVLCINIPTYVFSRGREVESAYSHTLAEEVEKHASISFQRPRRNKCSTIYSLLNMKPASATAVFR